MRTQHEKEAVNECLICKQRGTGKKFFGKKREAWKTFQPRPKLGPKNDRL